MGGKPKHTFENIFNYFKEQGCEWKNDYKCFIIINKIKIFKFYQQ